MFWRASALLEWLIVRRHTLQTIYPAHTHRRLGTYFIIDSEMDFNLPTMTYEMMRTPELLSGMVDRTLTIDRSPLTMHYNLYVDDSASSHSIRISSDNSSKSQACFNKASGLARFAGSVCNIELRKSMSFCIVDPPAE